MTGLVPLTPDSPEWYAQVAALPPPPCDAEALKRQLYDEFRVEAPIVTWNGRQFMRVSIQGYNTREDVEALVGALRVMIREA
mgnify:CR=1 FL=1